MKEIGGYFEIEKYQNKEYYNYLSFNSSRNALQFIIRKRNISKIYLPYYLCNVVEKALKYEKVNIKYYHIDSNFQPIIEDYDDVSFVYIVNFFGLLTKKDILNIKDKYNNIILDNTHSFFMKGFNNIDTIYNCRKYFGVPDGAYLYTNLKHNDEFNQALSLNRIKHLFGRYEENASKYYQSFVEADQSFENKNIELMSKITHNLLKSFDYIYIKKSRVDNFNYLNKKLIGINKLKINKENTCTFMYPLLVENGKLLKEYLISLKIYVPTLWKGLKEEVLNNFEKDILNNLVLIPIDQRYNIKDMQYILDKINKYIKGV